MGQLIGNQGGPITRGIQVMDLSEREFLRFSRLVYEQAGINLHQGKRELLRARLAKRIRELGFQSFSQYYDHVVTDDTGEEIVQMLDCIATNLTRFFREEAHFKFLEELVYPQFQQAVKVEERESVLRIWSAACSTGEEPYSIVMHAMDHLSAKVHVLATDISTKALQRASEGIYPSNRLSEIPPRMQSRFFLKGHGPREGFVRVKPEIRSCVTFRRHNLMEPPPVQGEMDVIFCRNVLIYFDRATQKRVVQNMAQVLRQGGYLFVGHAESLNGAVPQLRYMRPAVYRKP
jgi:chemotaxis protein methyltransferase CheR